MNRAMLVLFFLSACSASGADKTNNSHRGRPTIAAAKKNLASETNSLAFALKPNLVGKGTMDGVTIDAVQGGGDCDTTILTHAGAVKIDWSMQDNPTAYIDHGHQIMPVIDVSRRQHKLGLGSGHDAERVNASITMAYFDCAQKNHKT